MLTFSAVEIFGIAEQIERNGVRYYNAAAEQASGDLKDLLLELARMEEEHEKTFVDMRSRLDQAPLTLDDTPANAEVNAYIRAMAEGRVFDLRADPVDAVTPDAGAVLRKAIELEKDSIIFYIGMKELVPGARQQAQVHEIIRQEIRHIGMLSNELAALEQKK